MTRARAARGFTLVELIVALSIVGALLVIAFGGLRVAVASWHRADERIEAQQHARSLNVTLARSLGAAYAYRDARRQGEAPVLLFKGEPDRIEFVTQASPFPTEIPVAFTAVVIELRDDGVRKTLVIRQRILPNREAFIDAPIVVEDPSVQAVELSYLGEGGWQSEWTVEAEGGLPLAVKLTLGVPGAGGAREPTSITVALGGARK
jgi:general secretion pathway protein J